MSEFMLWFTFNRWREHPIIILSTSQPGDPGSDSAHDPYKVVVVHSYKQLHLVVCLYWLWQPVISGSMGNRIVDICETEKYRSVFIQCNSVYMGGVLTRAQWCLWDILHFQFFWAQVLPQTFQWDYSLKQSEMKWSTCAVKLWTVKIISSIRDREEMQPTCRVVLIANGSWLSGVFRILISAMETKTFCASRTFLSSSIT